MIAAAAKTIKKSLKFRQAGQIRLKVRPGDEGFPVVNEDFDLVGSKFKKNIL